MNACKLWIMTGQTVEFLPFRLEFLDTAGKPPVVVGGLVDAVEVWVAHCHHKDLKLLQLLDSPLLAFFDSWCALLQMGIEHIRHMLEIVPSKISTRHLRLRSL